MSIDKLPRVSKGIVEGSVFRLDVSGAVEHIGLAVQTGPEADDILLLPVASEAIGEGEWRLSFAIPDANKVLGAQPVLLAPNGEVARHLDTPTDTYLLSDLLPVKRTAVRRLIFHKKSRISHDGTLRFMLNQVLHSSENDYFERIEASKILAYRVLENVETDRLDEARANIETALTWVRFLPDTFGVEKTSRYQSRLSLIYLLYMIAVFAGDQKATRAHLATMFAESDEIPACPIAAYNVCLALLVSGFIEVSLGDVAHGKELFNHVIKVFRQAAVAMPSRNPGTFTELIVSFNASLQAAWALKEMRARSLQGDVTTTPALLATKFSRLRSDRATAFMASQLTQITGYDGTPLGTRGRATTD